jgi:hypothetical protein
LFYKGYESQSRERQLNLDWVMTRVCITWKVNGKLVKFTWFEPVNSQIPSSLPGSDHITMAQKAQSKPKLRKITNTTDTAKYKATKQDKYE